MTPEAEVQNNWTKVATLLLLAIGFARAGNGHSIRDGRSGSCVCAVVAGGRPMVGINFDCGDRDDYGFEEGAKALDKALKSRHIAHEAHIYAGRHDWQYFAEHLPDSLEFESRAFGK